MTAKAIDRLITAWKATKNKYRLKAEVATKGRLKSVARAPCGPRPDS
jgi:hypothetical protein